MCVPREPVRITFYVWGQGCGWRSHVAERWRGCPIIRVEHVLPQNPKADSEWANWIPEERQRLERVHQIGVLALLTMTSSARKKVYFSGKGGVSPFLLTTQVLNNSIWDADVIDGRQAELLRLFECHWCLKKRKDMLELLLSEERDRGGSRGSMAIFCAAYALPSLLSSNDRHELLLQF